MTLARSELLRRAGETLYGARWQSDLARDLGVADRTVRRWLAGVDQPRPGVWCDIIDLTQRRLDALTALRAEIAAECAPDLTRPIASDGGAPGSR